jgi:excisionase family DNA binding protein
LVDIPRVCHEIGVSRAQCYRLIATGELEACHVGRLIRVTGRSVERFVERQVQAERGHSGGD